MEKPAVKIEQKTNFVSFILLLSCVVISAILHFAFHLVVIFLIFVPPVIYYLLKKRDQNVNEEISDRFGNSD